MQEKQIFQILDCLPVCVLLKAIMEQLCTLSNDQVAGLPMVLDQSRFPLPTGPLLIMVDSFFFLGHFDFHHLILFHLQYLNLIL